MPGEPTIQTAEVPKIRVIEFPEAGRCFPGNIARAVSVDR